jgi:hypothetical protein
MDTAHLDGIITFLAAVAHALEYAGWATFLIVAGYCAAMHAAALLFTILRAILAFARECTAHMLRKLRPLLDEVTAWPKELRDAFASAPPRPTAPPESPHTR